MGIEDKEYHPPEVQVETFEVKKYSFNGGQSFICVTKDLDNALHLGRKNRSKFKEMIRNENSEAREAIIETDSTLNHVGIKSLRENGDNLKIFAKFQNLKAILKEFLLNKENEKEQFQKSLGNLQQLHINIPFIEALEQIPKYAKFMKYILSKKGKGSETRRIILNEQCSAVILNKVPPKEKDPGDFTIPCIIGQSGTMKALADLGASISLMSYSMFLRLNLGELKPTRMCIELANKTTQFPKGIAENVVVKIDKFVFPVDFVIFYMEEDHRIPIILGRPFLATTHAMIDVSNKKISFKVGKEIITFNLEKSMRFSPSVKDTYHSADIIDLSILENIKEIFTPTDVNSIVPIIYHLSKITEDYDNPTLFATDSKYEKEPNPKLKELPPHIEYAFMEDNYELLVIISSLLSSQEKKLLLEVLTKHKKALAWKISDNKGISPSFCSTTINKGLIQANPTSLPPQPIGEATKASYLRRTPPGVQRRSHLSYFLYLIVQK
ncbi:putative nucleotidyltransferase, ribonuclease H [Tanacetum coccineum]